MALPKSVQEIIKRQYWDLMQDRAGLMKQLEEIAKQNSEVEGRLYSLNQKLHDLEMFWKEQEDTGLSDAIFKNDKRENVDSGLTIKNLDQKVLE